MRIDEATKPNRVARTCVAGRSMDPERRREAFGAMLDRIESRIAAYEPLRTRRGSCSTS
jgi:hypothetical protein